IPQFEYESHGIEDPRIVKIEDLYYLTYTAYDGLNALGALALSSDLIHFEKKGIMVPQISYDEFKQLTGSKYEINKKYIRYNDNHGNTEHYGKKILIWDKNVIFFPERINGKLYFLHRIRPDIQLVCINELKDLTVNFWQKYLICFEEHILLTSKHKFEISYIGGGCPPIETEFGWLLIYHAVHDTLAGYVYSACAALLDLENPQIEIARLPYPLFKPQKEWELNGVVNNVCFPTGAITQDDTLYIYYGAADEQIALVSMSLSQLLKELISNK
ncbi:MAG: pesticidal protein Cry7Aa, partial [Bacteroidia bacterium]